MNLSNVEQGFLPRKKKVVLAVIIRRRVNWFQYLINKSAGKKDSHKEVNKNTYNANLIIFRNIMGLTFVEAQAVCREHYHADVLDEWDDLVGSHGYSHLGVPLI